MLTLIRYDINRVSFSFSLGLEAKGLKQLVIGKETEENQAYFPENNFLWLYLTLMQCV